MVAMEHQLTVSEIDRHHEHLLSEIRRGYEQIMHAAKAGHDVSSLRDDYSHFLKAELVPHALTEEETIYQDGAQQRDL